MSYLLSVIYSNLSCCPLVSYISSQLIVTFKSNFLLLLILVNYRYSKGERFKTYF